MWKDDNEKIQEIIKQTGTAYGAVNLVAKRARVLKQESSGVLSDSEALSWAITGKQPKDLENKIKYQESTTPEAKESDRVENILGMIEEDNIRTAVLNSYNASLRSHRIVLDYNGIKDKGIRTRIRVLTKMLYLGTQ